MTEEQLQVIKERVENSTQGPWRLDLWDGLLISEVTKGVILKAGQGRLIKAASEDIKFIAHAREDVPALITELELQKANAEQYLQDNVELHNENLILKNEIQRLNIALDRTELAEAKARMEIERLREIIKNAGCAMAEGENGDAYRYLYNGIGNGDYNYFERINEEEEKKFSEAIKRRLDGETK